MVGIMMLALVITSQNSAERHVRATEPRILALIDAGLSRSATFRGLVAALDASDVIVYIQPKPPRQNLGGYLPHQVVARGGYRYLRIAVDIQGVEGRLVPLLAHELQHALEVAQSPEVRDAESVERLFSRLAVPNACRSRICYETEAAIDVQQIVMNELQAFKN